MALTSLPQQWAESRFARCVARDVLESNQPPEFLWTSGKPNRYNPSGTQCIYFAETLELATLEYFRYLRPLETHPEPFTTYFADVKLPYVDLANAKIVSTFGLNVSDLRAPWRLSPSPTKTQLLGLAVSKQRHFAAIRYTSEAALAEGKTSCNYVISRDSIETPALLRVLIGNLVKVQEWP